MTGPQPGDLVSDGFVRGRFVRAVRARGVPRFAVIEEPDGTLVTAMYARVRPATMDALAVSCRACTAGVGQPCHVRLRPGEPMAEPHPSRWLKAVREDERLAG